MVTARFSHDGDAWTMNVRGHAAFAELGKDPVCAGASVLAMTIAQCAQTMYDAGKLQKKPHVTIRNGRVDVTAKAKPEYEGELRHTFFVGEVGMQLLSESYPDHVEIIRESD